MNDLLESVLDAHGGRRRWSDVKTFTTQLAVGGPSGSSGDSLSSYAGYDLYSPWDALQHLSKRSKAARREQAITALSGMVGAMVVARLVNDSALSDEILTVAASAFGGHKDDYPYFEAAYLGGGLGGYGLLAGDNPVRGLPHHRYAGDASVFGGADLRIYVSRFRLILPGTWGLLGFGDVGRVYVDGEDSNTWHHGYGGGLWFAWLDRANTISATYGRSEGRNAFYVRTGFAF